jgi:hypothetical protein
VSADFDRIRKSNDDFRTSRVNIDDDVLWPTNITSMGREFREAVLRAIREQTDFTHDEYGFHDYGSVNVAEHTIQWSIENRSTPTRGLVTDPDRAIQRAITVELE